MFFVMFLSALNCAPDWGRGCRLPTCWTSSWPLRWRLSRRPSACLRGTLLAGGRRPCWCREARLGCRPTKECHCNFIFFESSTVLVLRMAHSIWKETKQQPCTAGPGNMLGCCLISFHFLWAILSTSTVQSPSKRHVRFWHFVAYGRH